MNPPPPLPLCHYAAFLCPTLCIFTRPLNDFPIIQSGALHIASLGVCCWAVSWASLWYKDHANKHTTPSAPLKWKNNLPVEVDSHQPAKLSVPLLYQRVKSATLDHYLQCQVCFSHTFRWLLKLDWFRPTPSQHHPVIISWQHFPAGRQWVSNLSSWTFSHCISFSVYYMLELILVLE